MKLSIKNNIKLNNLATLFLKEQESDIIVEANSSLQIQSMLYLNPKIKEISYFNYQPQSESFCQLYISTDKGSIITLSLETLIQSSELMLVLPNTKTPEKIHIFYNNIFLYEWSQIGDSKGISAHPFGVFVLSNPLAGYSDQCWLINCNINLIDIINKSNLHLLDGNLIKIYLYYLQFIKNK